MKRFVIVAAIILIAAPMVFGAEQSPARSNVKPSLVPRQCLDNGSAEKGGYKFTCNKVDTAEVWNEIELRKFEKDIFEAYKQEIPKPQPVDAVTRVGLVVRQDTVTTREVPQIENVETKEVAVVEQRDGYKYRYAKR